MLFYVTLEVIGRKSGRTISLPVVVAVVDGERYLVAMLGEQVQWVHNVRAAGKEQRSEAVLVRRSTSKRFLPSNVPPS